MIMFLSLIYFLLLFDKKMYSLIYTLYLKIRIIMLRRNVENYKFTHLCMKMKRYVICGARQNVSTYTTDIKMPRVNFDE